MDIIFVVRALETDDIIIETPEIDMPFLPRVGDLVGLLDLPEESWVLKEEGTYLEDNADMAVVESVYYNPSMIGRATLGIIHVDCKVSKGD